MAYYVFVDNSNVWIEGKVASAVSKGLADTSAAAHENGIEDSAWRIDFGKLLSYAVDGNLSDVKKAILYGSKPPHNDSLWEAAKAANFEVKTEPRNAANKEKRVDTGMVHDIGRCLYKESKEGDVFVLVVGDGDYVPSVEGIKEEKRIAHVAFWNNVSGDLKRAVNCFIDLTPGIDKITL